MSTNHRVLPWSSGGGDQFSFGPLSKNPTGDWRLHADGDAHCGVLRAPPYITLDHLQRLGRPSKRAIRRFVISKATEKTFCECIKAMSGEQAMSVLDGGSRRSEFENTWKLVTEDPDVQAVLARLLFIPSEVPDLEQGYRLRDVVQHVVEGRSMLALFDDVVTTQAEVVRMHKEIDGKGPTYNVTYVYVDERKSEFSVKRSYGYDSMHSSINGWGESMLDRYWAVGQIIPCRYRKSRPGEHAIRQP
jgi:hypothetical protein